MLEKWNEFSEKGFGVAAAMLIAAGVFSSVGMSKKFLITIIGLSNVALFITFLIDLLALSFCSNEEEKNLQIKGIIISAASLGFDLLIFVLVLVWPLL